jgi:hypothetical protein
MEHEFQTVPMFLAALRGLPEVHDYRAMEFDLFTGEQSIEATDKQEDMLEELNTR